MIDKNEMEEAIQICISLMQRNALGRAFPVKPAKFKWWELKLRNGEQYAFVWQCGMGLCSYAYAVCQWIPAKGAWKVTKDGVSVKKKTSALKVFELWREMCKAEYGAYPERNPPYSRKISDEQRQACRERMLAMIEQKKTLLGLKARRDCPRCEHVYHEDSDSLILTCPNCGSRHVRSVRSAA